MLNKEVIFTRKDFNDFYKWINVDGAIWQGKNLEEFEKFWFSLFVDGLSLRQLTTRFEFLISASKIGPLSSCFLWLFEKVICYSFLNKNISIYQLSNETQLPLSRVSSILRNFFIDFHPKLNKYISTKFQISSVANDGTETKYEDIKEKLPMDEFGSTENDIMASIEVTLYPEWKNLVTKFQKNFLDNKNDIQKIQPISLKNQFSFFKDVAFLLVAGLAVIFLVWQGNQIYENYLIEKISAYEPQIHLGDDSLLPEREDNNMNDIAFHVRDIEEAENDRRTASKNSEEEERPTTESEVILTSSENLQRDFAGMDEVDRRSGRNRGYRDSLYGNTKVYRVMMRSTDILKSKQTLSTMMEAYGASLVNKINPIINVPGGINYNIFVPRIHIKEFLAQVEKIDQAVLYESRVRAIKDEPGKDRVFIWIKSLN